LPVFGSACPLWNAHLAFEAQGRITPQLTDTPDGIRYLSLATQVSKCAGGFRSGRTSYVLALGCEISYAESFVYSGDMNLTERASAEPIGISCRLGERAKCPSMAMPPLKRKLAVDHHNRLPVPYEPR